jgi:cyclohexadienyl dehydratase
VEAFAAEQGQQPSWVRFRWGELVEALGAGRFDMAASGITVRPERSVAGRYTVPVARTGAVLLLRRPGQAQPSAGPSGDRESALATLRLLDKPGLRVAVNRGGHLERVARALFHQAQLLPLSPNAAVREALASGQVDAALSNSIEAPRWAEGLADVELLGPLTSDVVALYVHPDQPELAARLDAWLLAQEESGALGRLRERHLGPGAGGPVARPVEALLAATAERLALMPLVAAAKQRAGTVLEDTAQEARVLEAARVRVREAAAAAGVSPPPEEAVTAFFQTQIDLAKALQSRARVETSTPTFSLKDELRPAVARVTARMAMLVARLPAGLERDEVLRQVRDWLSDSGLTAEEMDKLVGALLALHSS